MRALYDYRAQREDELSFVKHAIINNVQKQDGGWSVLTLEAVSASKMCTRHAHPFLALLTDKSAKLIT